MYTLYMYLFLCLFMRNVILMKSYFRIELPHTCRLYLFMQEMSWQGEPTEEGNQSCTQETVVMLSLKTVWLMILIRKLNEL